MRALTETPVHKIYALAFLFIFIISFVTVSTIRPDT